MLCFLKMLCSNYMTKSNERKEIEKELSYYFECKVCVRSFAMVKMMMRMVVVIITRMFMMVVMMMMIMVIVVIITMMFMMWWWW